MHKARQFLHGVLRQPNFSAFNADAFLGEELYHFRQ
jgi:hypothetical protein